MQEFSSGKIWIFFTRRCHGGICLFRSYLRQEARQSADNQNFLAGEVVHWVPLISSSDKGLFAFMVNLVPTTMDFHTVDYFGNKAFSLLRWNIHPKPLSLSNPNDNKSVSCFTLKNNVECGSMASCADTESVRSIHGRGKGSGAGRVQSPE